MTNIYLAELLKHNLISYVFGADVFYKLKKLGKMMIYIKNGRILEKWFSEKTSKKDSYKFVHYRQCKNLKNDLFFKRVDFYTKTIDLEIKDNEIFDSFNKNCREKIKRIRNKTNFEVENNIDSFINFYNEFSDLRGRNRLTEKFTSYCRNIIVTKATYDDEVMVMHSYLIDKNIGRVRLLHSVSHFNVLDDSKKRNLIGMLNRYLHFEDMKYFKEQGFNVYDLGGYAYETKSEKLLNINHFKDQFGGTLVRESSYISYPLYFAQTLMCRQGQH